MNKKFIVGLSSLLKVDENVITEAIQNEEGDDSIIKEYTSKNQSYTPDDLAKLIENSNKAYIEKADFDINNVPSNLYNKIKGASLESKEKSIAKKYEIDSYEDLDDLVGKIAESKSNIGGSKTDDASLKQIEALKKQLEDNEKLSNEKVELAEANANKRVVDIERGLAFDNLGTILNYDSTKDDSGVSQLDTHLKLYKSAFNSTRKQEFKDGKVLTYNRETGDLLVDKLGEPITPSDAVKQLAEEYRADFKKPDMGGRGTQGSEPKDSLTGVSLGEAMASRNIKPYTDEADKFTQEWQAANN